ncbi:MAG: hypothetical protein ACJA2E_002082 [Arenicella sp.]|jgi:hypothetical protein
MVFIHIQHIVIGNLLLLNLTNEVITVEIMILVTLALLGLVAYIEMTR